MTKDRENSTLVLRKHGGFRKLDCALWGMMRHRPK
jgi:hypothetical protein